MRTGGEPGKWTGDSPGLGSSWYRSSHSSNAEREYQASSSQGTEATFHQRRLQEIYSLTHPSEVSERLSNRKDIVRVGLDDIQSLGWHPHPTVKLEVVYPDTSPGARREHSC